MKKILIALLPVILFVSCDFLGKILGDEFCLRFLTNPNIDLYVIGQITESDSSLPQTSSDIVHVLWKEDLGNTPVGFMCSKENDWEKRLAGNNIMRIFVLDADVVENHDWETIRENYMILVRYDLSFADCEKIGWTLDYPPTEAMKDIPMYPPYEEVIENYNRMMEQEE